MDFINTESLTPFGKAASAKVTKRKYQKGGKPKTRSIKSSAAAATPPVDALIKPVKRKATKKKPACVPKKKPSTKSKKAKKPTKKAKAKKQGSKQTKRKTAPKKTKRATKKRC